jgi:TP901 family phage tail tape measure protein
MATGVEFVISAIDDFTKTFDNLSTKTEKVLGAAKVTGAALTGMGVAGAAGIAAVTNAAATFDGSMRNVNTMAKLSEDQFADLKSEVIDLSKRVPESADSLAKGLYDVVSAGVPATDQMGFLETASIAASAGLTDTSTSVSAITGVIKGYGMEFEKAADVSDLLFTVVENGQTDFESLATSITGVAPIAASAGVSFEELSATYATLTGVTGNASEVTTQMKSVLSNIIKPSSQAIEKAEELGIEFNQQALEAQGLEGFLGGLMEATGGNIDEMAQLFGSVEALNAVMALAGPQAETFAKNQEAMANATGAAKAAFDEQMKSFGPQWELLKNTVMAVALEIGNRFLPYAIQAAEWISNIVSRVSEANPNFIAMAAAVLLGVTAFGLIVGPILLVIGFIRRLHSYRGSIRSNSWGAYGNDWMDRINRRCYCGTSNDRNKKLGRNKGVHY